MIQPCRVVKIGGSFFAHRNYSTRLVCWLRQQTPMHCVIVTGGGVWADAVRRLDGRHGLPSSTTHWMAIRAMSLTSWLLAVEERQLQYVDRWTTLRNQLSHKQPAQLVFDMLHFLQTEEPHQSGRSLPHGWHVTSDSIAARLAELLGAFELVLLKPTPSNSLREAVSNGSVDAYFETAATGLNRIRIESLARAS